MSGASAPNINTSSLNTLTISGGAAPTITGLVGTATLLGGSLGGGMSSLTLASSGSLDHVVTSGAGGIGSLSLGSGAPSVCLSGGIIADSDQRNGIMRAEHHRRTDYSARFSQHHPDPQHSESAATVILIWAAAACAFTPMVTANLEVATAIELVAIGVTTYPTKLSYKTSDTSLDTSGMVVTGYYRVLPGKQIFKRVLELRGMDE